MAHIPGGFSLGFSQGFEVFRPFAEMFFTLTIVRKMTGTATITRKVDFTLDIMRRVPYSLPIAMKAVSVGKVVRTKTVAALIIVRKFVRSLKI